MKVETNKVMKVYKGILDLVTLLLGDANISFYIIFGSD